MQIDNGPVPINDVLKNIVLKGADPITAKGFTQVPNHVLESKDVSPGAKLAYAMLLKYAWQNSYCFPGQVTLAEDMGSSERSVRTYLHELQDQGFLTIKRQGQGKPNIYELNLTTSSASVDK